jgi:hypothetical protein
MEVRSLVGHHLHALIERGADQVVRDSRLFSRPVRLTPRATGTAAGHPLLAAPKEPVARNQPEVHFNSGAVQRPSAAHPRDPIARVAVLKQLLQRRHRPWQNAARHQVFRRLGAHDVDRPDEREVGAEQRGHETRQPVERVLVVIGLVRGRDLVRGRSLLTNICLRAEQVAQHARLRIHSLRRQSPALGVADRHRRRGHDINERQRAVTRCTFACA